MVHTSPRRRPPFPRGLYAIVDLDSQGGRDHLCFASAVLAQRPCALQLRAKHVLGGDLLALAAPLREMCRRSGVAFIVNDRIDVAIAIGADGVHVGQEDIPAVEARRLLHGSDVCLLGVSTHDLAQARQAWALGADYIGFGPVRPTASKPQAKDPVGVDGVARCARMLSELGAPVPALVAIGGIDLATARDLSRSGAHAAAVIGALVHADDPGSTALQFVEAFS